jgi:hypothetical protein
LFSVPFSSFSQYLIQLNRRLLVMGLMGFFQGSIFWSENIIYSPPPRLSKNVIFPPLATWPFFDSYDALSAIVLPYFAFNFTLLLPLFSLSSLFFFFPQMTSADILPLWEGGIGFFLSKFI